MRKKVVELYPEDVYEKPEYDEFKLNVRIAERDFYTRRRAGEMETVRDFLDWYTDWFFYAGHRNMGYTIKNIAERVDWECEHADLVEIHAALTEMMNTKGAGNEEC